MRKNANIRNIAMAILQTVITGIVIFIIYRYLLDTIGVIKLGIWSVVLASASAIRLTELGFSGSVIKFVAKYLAHCEEIETAQIIETATICIGAVIGGALVIAYPLLVWALDFFIPKHSINDAINILPYALVSFWLLAIASVFQSALDGCRRIDLRSISMIAAQILRLLLVFLLVPYYGLIGLAYGQVIQSATILILSWILIKHQIKKLSFLPYHWSKKSFREMLWYGVNFQIINVVKMLFDPITKALLSKFGGLSIVGYYEMANRLVMQCRGLIVSGNQVIVPQIATIKETAPESLNQIYRKCYSIVLYFSVPFYAIIAGLLPIIGYLWIGHYEPIFVYSGLFLILAWFLNSLAAPAYFANLGIGKMRWNTLAHLIIGILNGGLGYSFGILYGGWGVIMAFTISLILGSSILVIAYHFENQISFLNLLPKEFLGLIGFCSFAAGISLMTFFGFHLKWSVFFEIALILSILVLFIGPPLWKNPMRATILKEFVHMNK